MAITRSVHKWERICPIRFERNVPGIYNKQSSGPVRDSPDFDDRGFAEDTNGLRGPVLSVMMAPPVPLTGDKTKVKLIREDIDNAAQLEAKSSDEAKFKIVSPVGKFSGSKTTEIEIEAVAAGDANLEICFDGNDDWVVGELVVRVVDQASGGDLLVRPYEVTVANAAGLGGIGPAARDYARVFDVINDIWRPHGIQFRRLAMRQKRLRLHTPGVITESAPGRAAFDEFRDAMKANDTAGRPPDPNAINVLFAHSLDGSEGLGLQVVGGAGVRGAGDTYGVMIADPNTMHPWTDAITIAHELGHYLHLEHVDDTTPATGSDVWRLRSMMEALWPPPAPSWRNNVGYGNSMYGAHIPIRQLGTLAQGKWDEDGQHAIARGVANGPRIY